ncbi:glycosyltransferase family 2 protein [Saccharicrinis sp. 156]|uniref:glycosyltransferase family 2 protein n=1 Tax=Saccharicrinis sp. 156 TaxID=3417574 RepID=UPI003D32A5BD
MKYLPLVSVLMTVYNREKYIAEAIESVMASTYPNWELIIVDDRSKDHSVEIARSYETKDARIKVYVNETNLGDYPNRNKAASYAKGKYLKYVDADDMIYPYGLEQLVYYMEQFPEAGYGLCSLDQDKNQIFPFQLSPQQAYQRHYFQTPLFHKAPLSAIIKKAAFDKTGGFTGKRMLGDFEMWNLLSQKFPVVLMPHGMVWYRLHDDQESSLHRSDPMEPFKYLLLTSTLLTDDNCPLPNKDQQVALKQNKQKIARAVLSAAKHHSIKKGMELKKASKMSLLSILSKGTR